MGERLALLTHLDIKNILLNIQGSSLKDCRDYLIVSLVFYGCKSIGQILNIRNGDFCFINDDDWLIECIKPATLMSRIRLFPWDKYCAKGFSWKNKNRLIYISIDKNISSAFTKYESYFIQGSDPTAFYFYSMKRDEGYKFAPENAYDMLKDRLLHTKYKNLKFTDVRKAGIAWRLQNGHSIQEIKTYAGYRDMRSVKDIAEYYGIKYVSDWYYEAPEFILGKVSKPTKNKIHIWRDNRPNTTEVFYLNDR